MAVNRAYALAKAQRSPLIQSTCAHNQTHSHDVTIFHNIFMPPPLIGGGIKRCFCLTSVCRAIGPKSRTERPMKRKIGTDNQRHYNPTSHVRDSDTTFKVKRSRSPGRFAHCCFGASGGCSGGRENVLAVGNCCYVAVCSAAQDASAPTGGGEERGGGITWRPPAYSLLLLNRRQVRRGVICQLP